MGETKGKPKRVTTANAHAVDQQCHHGLKPLFNLSEMANAQQMHRPFMDRFYPARAGQLNLTTKRQRGDGLNDNTLRTEAIHPKTIAGLQKTKRHSIVAVTQTRHTTHTVNQTKRRGPVLPDRIKSHRLQARHRHHRIHMVGNNSGDRNHAALTVENGSQHYPFAFENASHSQ